MEDQKTKFRMYSHGIVAANKALDSNDVEVTPTETNPMADGELSSNADTLKASGTNQDGSAYQAQATVTNTLKCTWLPFGSSNRSTAPDVRRGEEVMIWQMADSDKYYWTPLIDGSKQRKLETVVHQYSGTQDESAAPSAENSYYMEVSTHKKIMHLHTSQANGEKYGFDIQINADQGFIQIQDTSGTVFTFDPSEQQITMKNATGTLLDINKGDVTIKAGGNISITAGGSCTIQSSNTNLV